jgi:hypothetical protein
METPIQPFRRSQRVAERCPANDDVESMTIIACSPIEDRVPHVSVSTTRAHYNREVGGNFRHLLSPRLLNLANDTVQWTTGASYI